ncbi:MAG: hypothetical protein JJU29_06525 [Verrucomicrobia bacterium]|nr:hypothetical protein [Verrucomicrobiota bacterium]MCH8510319.1 hypothetical protein [Kiritimatiellia bacterium]
MIRSAKSGSALVATILMLAILLVLSLLYTVQVRLEGRITEFQQAGTLARGGLHSAQAEAMRDIAATYTNRVYAVPGQERTWHSKGTVASGAEWLTPDTATELGWPDRLRETGPNSLYERAQKAGWTEHGDPNDWHLATAWVAADLTGLLDPNVVGRSDALDPEPAGIQMRGFMAAPSVWDRDYLTPGEFIAANSATEALFFPDTWSVDRGWYEKTSETSGAWRTEVEVNAQTLNMFSMTWDEDQVREVMAALYPDQDAEELTNAFFDFRDWEVALVPRQVDGLTAIPIPMFNEVFVEVKVTRNEERTDVEVQLDIELWLPSVGNVVEGSFRVSETPEIEVENFVLQPQETLEDWAFADPSPFTTLSMSFSLQGAPMEEPGPLSVKALLGTLRLEREIGGSWVVIDRMPENLELEILVTEEGYESGRGGLEVVDPRLNHRLDLWEPTDAHSLGEINVVTKTFIDADPDLDPPYTHMPAESLEVASNIRFFPVGEPWRSVDLFGPDGRWWLRHTRDTGWEPGRWRRGVVNPNSMEPKVLESVFLDVPIPVSPLDTEPPGPLGFEDVASIAEDMVLAMGWEIEEDFPEDLSEGGTVQRGDWTWALRDNPELLNDMDRHQAEAVVAFVQPRFESASQVWGMILVSEWRSPQGVARARARAVSVIWRDPYADENGRHAWSQMHWIPLP